ncbi:MAG: hypothetical protein QM537_05535 [Candidatus Symbiobacter sp.]|nr:hypothetical protein [Candidatus Symbiobacter sp.]
MPADNDQPPEPFQVLKVIRDTLWDEYFPIKFTTEKIDDHKESDQVYEHYEPKGNSFFIKFPANSVGKYFYLFKIPDKLVRKKTRNPHLPLFKRNNGEGNASHSILKICDLFIYGTDGQNYFGLAIEFKNTTKSNKTGRLQAKNGAAFLEYHKTLLFNVYGHERDKQPIKDLIIVPVLINRPKEPTNDWLKPTTGDGKNQIPDCIIFPCHEEEPIDIEKLLKEINELRSF